MASRFKIRQDKSINVFPLGIFLDMIKIPIGRVLYHYYYLIRHQTTNHGLQRVNIIQFQIFLFQQNCNQKININEIQIMLKYGFKDV